MALADDKRLDPETHKKYAKLWLLCRRLFQARKPAFTPQDVAFLKRVIATPTLLPHCLRKQAH